MTISSGTTADIQKKLFIERAFRGIFKSDYTERKSNVWFTDDASMPLSQEISPFLDVIERIQNADVTQKLYR